MATAYKDGLEDIIAARSAICRVDGEAGRLYYRGYEIADLASAASFEDTTRLLWFGELPSAAERAEFGARLAETRALPPAERAGLCLVLSRLINLKQL
ncbi:MAG: citrate/2-methylcitrate synthase [Candidatus Rokuibacteriota bacterium]